MALPVFKLVINNEDPELGVDFIALVDNPAIQRNWIAFNKSDPHRFKIQDEEKRVVSGPLMVADELIFRRDAKGNEYNVLFDAPTIWAIVQKYFKAGNQDKVNLMHKNSETVKGAYCFESFIIDSKRGINTPKGFEILSDGSWFGSFKIDDDKVWEDIKEGKFMGFSVQGFFDMIPETDFSEQEAEKELIALLKEHLNIDITI